MSRRTARICGCVLLLFLLCSGATIFVNRDTPWDNGVSLEAVKPVHSGYVEHGMITIENELALQGMGFPGDGSESNPYIISNLNITANGTCISIANTISHLVLNACYFERPYEEDVESVHIYNVTNCRIINCNIVGGSISAENFREGSIDHCNLTAIWGSGVFLYSTINISIAHNRLVNCSTAIQDEVSATNNVTQNYISQCGIGITNEFTSTEYATLYHNNTMVNCDTGLYVEDEGTFTNNSILDCATGIYVHSPWANIAYNKIEGFRDYGIRIYSSYHCNLTGNSIEGASSLGMLMGISEGMRLSDNMFFNCGISLSENDWEGHEEHWPIEVIGNTVNGRSIEYIRDQSGITMNLSLYGQAIIYNCSNCLFEDGFFEKVPEGVFIAYSDSIALKSTTIIGNEKGNAHGVSLFESTNCTVRNCTFIGTGLGIYSEMYLWNHTVEDCKVNGKTLGYFRDESDTVLDADDFGQIILVDSENVRIQNGRISNSSNSIQIIHCTDCVVENVTLDSSLCSGIRLDYSTDCMVTSCNLTNNEYGSVLFHLFQCEIRNSTITHNEMGIFDRDALDCRIYYNLIGLNTLDAQTYTVYIYYDDGISLGNYWIGYDGSDFVEIYHNFAVGTGTFEIVDRFPNGTRHDWTPPVITLTSENLTYTYGDPYDQVVYCDVDDDHSGRYRVFIDGTLARYGYWWPYPGLHGNPYSVLPKDLSVGLHNVTFLIEDLGAYFASTTIWVTILPVTNTTTTTTTTSTTTTTTTSTTTNGGGFMQSVILGFGVASGVVALVVFVMIARKRSAG